MGFLLFDSYHSQQANWISGQLEKGKADSFLDLYEAQKDFDSSLVPLGNAREIECFRTTHLSEKGVSRLKTTLKVYSKRQKDKARARNLDVTVSLEAFQQLEKICLNTGLTKTAVIEQFLINSKNETLLK